MHIHDHSHKSSSTMMINFSQTQRHHLNKQCTSAWFFINAWAEHLDLLVGWHLTIEKVTALTDQYHGAMPWQDLNLFMPNIHYKWSQLAEPVLDLPVKSCLHFPLLFCLVISGGSSPLLKAQCILLLQLAQELDIRNPTKHQWKRDIKLPREIKL